MSPPGVGRWLEPLAGHWLPAARARLACVDTVVRVTVVALRGSAPREPGASMLVDAAATLGTIGGGRLEWQATAAARQLLGERGSAAVRIDDILLGPQLGQCCGGRVELWLERLSRADLEWLQAAERRMRAGRAPALITECGTGAVTHRLRRMPQGAAPLELRRTAGAATLIEDLAQHHAALWIFGAGHVGQALVRLLAPLRVFDITWLDSRCELLPDELPDRVTPRACAAPAEEALLAAAGTRYLVITHDHALDYLLCRTILRRSDAAWLGLIGSASKAARFRSRLLREGLSRAALDGLTCPVGIPGMHSKLPAAIAISIAAQMLQPDPARLPPARVAPTDAPADARGSLRARRGGTTACAQHCAACGPEPPA